MLGYHRRVALVDLSTGTVEYLQPAVTQLRDFIGGRGLGAALLSEQGAITEPLDPESVVCLMAGPLTGTDFPLANRLAFVFRSPLTRTIAWAMTGGYVATELKKGGIDGLIIRGRAADPCYVMIEGTRIEIRPAQLLWGMGAVESVTALRARQAGGPAHA